MPKVYFALILVFILLGGFYLYSSSLNSTSFAGVKQQVSDNVVGLNPGSLIHSEKLPAGTVANANIWKIWYVSTDFKTNFPIEVSGVVFAPQNATASAKLPVVAWAHGTAGIAEKCAMSFLPNGGSAKIPGLQDFIDNGYVVVATDYPGLGTPGGHPYLVGKSEAYAVLDNVKVLQKMKDINADKRFVVWGHSQGGHASLFTGQLASEYAPELNLVGIAATSPATDLSRLLSLDIGTVPGNVLASLAFVAWSNVYDGANLNQILNPLSMPVAKNIASYCLTSAESDWEDIIAGNLLKLGFVQNDPSAVQPWSEILQQNTPDTWKNDQPFLITQGSADTLVHPEVTQTFVNNLCKSGNNVQYQTLPGVGHLPAGFDSVPIVLPWIKDRFAGLPSESNCP